MSRILEAALLLAPLATYLLWRTLLARGVPNPSARALGVLGIAVILLAAGLFWTSQSERHPGGTRYVPAEERDGRIIPGHAT